MKTQRDANNGLKERLHHTLVAMGKSGVLDISKHQRESVVNTMYDIFIDFLAHRTGVVSVPLVLRNAFVEAGLSDLVTTDLIENFELLFFSELSMAHRNCA